MFRRISAFFSVLSAVRVVGGVDEESELLLLKVPKKTLQALATQHLNPGDDLTQLFKDALGTHWQVMGAMQQGCTVVVQKGKEFAPLDLSHIITPEVHDALAAIVSKARRV